jgi:hypothetical protein
MHAILLLPVLLRALAAIFAHSASIDRLGSKGLARHREAARTRDKAHEGCVGRYGAGDAPHSAEVLTLDAKVVR